MAVSDAGFPIGGRAQEHTVLTHLDDPASGLRRSHGRRLPPHRAHFPFALRRGTIVATSGCLFVMLILLELASDVGNVALHGPGGDAQVIAYSLLVDLYGESKSEPQQHRPQRELTFQAGSSSQGSSALWA